MVINPEQSPAIVGGKCVLSGLDPAVASRLAIKLDFGSRSLLDGRSRDCIDYVADVAVIICFFGRSFDDQT